MIVETITSLGPWSWLILGFALLVGEAVIPGVFLMWFGLAGIVVGALSFMPFADMGWWPWQVQVVAFGILSLAFVLMSIRLFPSNGSDDDEASKMNNPLQKFVGREADLVEAIESGIGRIKLGDTTWRVRGEDMKAGKRIRVIGVEDQTLLVEAV